MNTLTLNDQEYVVVPKNIWQGMVDIAEDRADSQFAAAVLDRMSDEERFPHDFVVRLCSGEEPRLRVWREYRGFSGRKLAEAVGISSAHLSDIETGKKDGSIRVLKRIADVLNVTVDDIV